MNLVHARHTRVRFAIVLFLLFSATSLGLRQRAFAEEPASKKDGATAERVLRFPADRAMGTVSWRPAVEGSYYGTQYQGWQEPREAIGEVRVPRDADVMLRVSSAAAADLSGLDELDPEDVQVLDFRNTPVKDDQLGHVGRLTGLRILNFDYAPITDAGIAHLGQLEQLEEINLSAFGVERQGFGVGDAALEVLAGLPGLRGIDLRLCKVTDAGLAHLAGLKSLESLGLAGTQVSDEGLKQLANFPRLKVLTLGVYDEGANITDAGLQHLGALSALEELGLSGTKITNDGLKHLKTLTGLKSLSLDHTKVSDEGLAHLEPLAALESLRLYTQSPTTDAGAAHLAKLKSLRNLSENLSVSDKGVALLAELPLLERLSLSGSGVTDEGVRAAAGMKSLKSLWLQDCAVTDAGLAALADAPQLEMLLLAGAKMTSAGLESIGKLPLRNLHLRLDETGEPLTLAPIGRMRQLEQLDLVVPLAGNDELAHLANLKLESLELGMPLDDEAAPHLAALTSLTRLDMRRSLFNDAALVHLAELKNLSYLTIAGTFTDRGLQHLARLPKLAMLQVGSPNVTESGLKALAEKMPTLQSTNLWTSRAPQIVVGKEGIRRDGDRRERALLDELEDKPAPALTVTDWINTPPGGLALDDLRGKVVLVDFWGTWCGPCRRMTPVLKALYEKHHAEGLEIVGVHTTNGGEEMAAYVTEHGIAWPMAIDVEKVTAKAWSVSGYPGFFLIDRQGNLRMADVYNADVRRAVQMLLEEPASNP